jgi:hypothetical protein
MHKFGTVVMRELREMLPAMLFFLAAFHLIDATRAAILRNYHMTAETTMVATVSALIVAKAILIADKLPIARRFSSRAVYNVVWRAVLFTAVALLFRDLEELIPVWLKHGSVADTVREKAAGSSWLHFGILHVWLFTLVLLYCIGEVLVDFIGRDRVWGLLKGPRPTRPGD